MTKSQKPRTSLIYKSLKRADRALSCSFYLESLALADSLITDRVRVIAQFSSDKRVEIRGVNNGVKNLQNAKVDIFDPDLIELTLRWGKLRNSAIHGITKLHEFESMTWRRRLSESKLAAQEGVALAKRWLAESKKHKI
jgi:hypothetical protein